MEKPPHACRPVEAEPPLHIEDYTNRIAALVYVHGGTMQAAYQAFRDGTINSSNPGLPEFLAIIEMCPWAAGISPGDDRPNWLHLEPPTSAIGEIVVRKSGRTFLERMRQLLQTAALL